jgi:hypothetical protein
MLTQYRVRGVVLAAALAMGRGAPAFADTMPPSPHQENGITYVTGGIGDEERTGLEASSRNYNLHIESAEKGGSFLAGIDLAIQAKNGKDVLRVRNTGPLFYAQLPPGDYTIHAAYKGAERVKDAQVGGKGAADIHFVWPGAD